MALASSPDNVGGDFAQLLMSAAVRPGREPDGMSRAFWPDTSYEMLALTIVEKKGWKDIPSKQCQSR